MEELPCLQAISELAEIARQAFVIMANGPDFAAYRRASLARFRNAETIARHVPAFRLEISCHARFWKAIENSLNPN